MSDHYEFILNHGYDTSWIALPNNGGEIMELREITDELNRLKRERDELKKQLIDAKSSIAHWMGKYNNAVQLRGEDPLCDSFWKTLDKLASERALADRLVKHLEDLLSGCFTPAFYEASITAWKEARSE